MRMKEEERSGGSDSGRGGVEQGCSRVARGIEVVIVTNIFETNRKGKPSEQNRQHREITRAEGTTC
jgi:hypothetical protein